MRTNRKPEGKKVRFFSVPDFKLRRKSVQIIKFVLFILFIVFITVQIREYNKADGFAVDRREPRQHAEALEKNPEVENKVGILARPVTKDDQTHNAIIKEEKTHNPVIKEEKTHQEVKTVAANLAQNIKPLETKKTATEKQKTERRNAETLASQEKIDWQNYTHIRLEGQRVGNGEQGKPANYSHLSKEMVDEIYKINGYNGAVSDIISLHRSVKDVRPPNCSKILYRKHLPDASVIIPFHNEHLSVLLRTIWSVINRSPEHLIKDIILVDDYSIRKPLKEELDIYIKENFPKVKIIRLDRRRGLIVARQAGARLAQGQVLLFLDAHCEANVNWLPPLLDLIAQDYKTCPCPLIDDLNQDNLEYTYNEGGRGAFDWHLTWRIMYKFKKYGRDTTEPFKVPVMNGGLFAISAKYFWEFGGYDEGLYIWGGEQFEISFKIWQCGGKVVDVPCSRVAHIFRKFTTYSSPENTTDFWCKNNRRFAEVWMDEYKKYYYMRHPECEALSYGDISKQVEIRKKLNCKPFKWYMEEVAYDVTNRYPLIEPPDIAYGEMRNVGHPNVCIETTEVKVNLNNCSSGKWEQKVRFSWRGEIRHEETLLCWDIDTESYGRIPVKLYFCHFAAGNQLWRYNEKYMSIEHNTGLCLDMDEKTMALFVADCKRGSTSQQWKIQNFNKAQQDKVMEYVKHVRIDEKE